MVTSLILIFLGEALMLVIDYIAGDEFGGSCRISYSLDDDPTAAIASPGRYALSWRR